MDALVLLTTLLLGVVALVVFGYVQKSIKLSRSAQRIDKPDTAVQTPSDTSGRSSVPAALSKASHAQGISTKQNNRDRPAATNNTRQSSSQQPDLEAKAKSSPAGDLTTTSKHVKEQSCEDDCANFLLEPPKNPAQNKGSKQAFSAGSAKPDSAMPKEPGSQCPESDSKAGEDLPAPSTPPSRGSTQQMDTESEQNMGGNEAKAPSNKSASQPTPACSMAVEPKAASAMHKLSSSFDIAAKERPPLMSSHNVVLMHMQQAHDTLVNPEVFLGSGKPMAISDLTKDPVKHQNANHHLEATSMSSVWSSELAMGLGHETSYSSTSAAQQVVVGKGKGLPLSHDSVSSMKPHVKPSAAGLATTSTDSFLSTSTTLTDGGSAPRSSATSKFGAALGRKLSAKSMSSLLGGKGKGQGQAPGEKGEKGLPATADKAKKPNPIASIGSSLLATIREKSSFSETK